MAENVTLAAERRDRAGKGAARATRRSGLVPGVIYGDKQSPVLVALDPRLIHAEMRKKGFHTRIFEIAVGGKTERALVRDLQFHPVTDQPIHIDFQRVGVNSLVHVAVPVVCINDASSPGIKKGGVLNLVHHEIDLVCRADNMPENIVIDLAGLDIGDSVHISSIALPEGARSTSTEKDLTLVTIAPPSGGAKEA